jgi:hypothetical protein
MVKKDVVEPKVSENKYVHLGNGYDKDWFFIMDEKELQECLKDYSVDEDEYVVEIKKIYKVKKNVETTFSLEEMKKDG